MLPNPPKDAVFMLKEGLLYCQGLESVPPAAAREMLATGDWVLVDIRPENKYQSAHPAGAKNVQLYRKVRACACVASRSYWFVASGLLSRKRVNSVGLPSSMSARDATAATPVQSCSVFAHVHGGEHASSLNRS